jgi:hypothetical protein
MRAGFPDIVFSIQEQVAERDKVASRFEWTGTHRGEFIGIPATGRTVGVWGMVIDRLEDRIKDTRGFTVTAVLTLAFGIAGNAAIFTLVKEPTSSWNEASPPRTRQRLTSRRRRQSVLRQKILQVRRVPDRSPFRLTRDAILRRL